MRVQQRGQYWRYRSHRRWPAPQAGSDIAVRVGSPIAPTPLEVFLTARWGLHSTIAGRTVFTPNEHEPWSLHEAELVHLQDGLVRAAGIQTDGLVGSGDPDLRVLWSPGVRTRFAAPIVVPS
jgi:uncharacterized protein YqjF (DUF2071 family)